MQKDALRGSIEGRHDSESSINRFPRLRPPLNIWGGWRQRPNNIQSAKRERCLRWWYPPTVCVHAAFFLITHTYTARTLHKRNTGNGAGFGGGQNGAAGRRRGDGPTAPGVEGRVPYGRAGGCTYAYVCTKVLSRIRVRLAPGWIGGRSIVDGDGKTHGTMKTRRRRRGCWRRSGRLRKGCSGACWPSGARLPTPQRGQRTRTMTVGRGKGQRWWSWTTGSGRRCGGWRRRACS